MIEDNTNYQQQQFPSVDQNDNDSSFLNDTPLQNEDLDSFANEDNQNIFSYAKSEQCPISKYRQYHKNSVSTTYETFSETNQTQNLTPKKAKLSYQEGVSFQLNSPLIKQSTLDLNLVKQEDQYNQQYCNYQFNNQQQVNQFDNNNNNNNNNYSNNIQNFHSSVTYPLIKNDEPSYQQQYTYQSQQLNQQQQLQQQYEQPRQSTFQSLGSSQIMNEQIGEYSMNQNQQYSQDETSSDYFDNNQNSIVLNQQSQIQDFIQPQEPFQQKQNNNNNNNPFQYQYRQTCPELSFPTKYEVQQQQFMQADNRDYQQQQYNMNMNNNYFYNNNNNNNNNNNAMPENYRYNSYARSQSVVLDNIQNQNQFNFDNCPQYLQQQQSTTTDQDTSTNNSQQMIYNSNNEGLNGHSDYSQIKQLPDFPNNSSEQKIEYLSRKFLTSQSITDYKEMEKSLQILGRKKNASNKEEAQKFRNMKKLVMNGVLKYYTPEVLEKFAANIPIKIKEDIVKIADNIRKTGKQESINNKKMKKMDLFSQPHFNLVFLALNDQTCREMSKNQMNIELHNKIFDFNIKSYNKNMETLDKIEYINAIKQFMYLIAKKFLEINNPMEQDVVREYKQVVLTSLAQMINGKFINKFCSFKQLNSKSTSEIKAE